MPKTPSKKSCKLELLVAENPQLDIQALVDMCKLNGREVTASKKELATLVANIRTLKRHIKIAQREGIPGAVASLTLSLSLTRIIIVDSQDDYTDARKAYARSCQALYDHLFEAGVTKTK